VRILTNRLSTQTSSSVAQSVGSVVAQVFLGAAFAFAVAFLVPHALATRTISASYNVWSLMILGGVAGYASSGIAGSVREGLQGLLSGLRQGVAEAIVKEEVSKTIAESAKEALALPEPVAYAGIVEVEVADERGISAVKTFSRPTAPAGSPETLPEGPGILLEADTTYSIRIYLIPHVASRGPRPTRPIVFPIDIEGMRVPVVPLEVRVDYGFQELEIARHQAEARVDSETELRPFTFKAPSVPDPVALTATPDAEPSISRRLTIAILQNKIPYVRRQIPITLAATGFSPPESSSMPASS